MRKFIAAVLIAAITATILYFGSSVISLKSLSDAVVAGSADEVIARTDLRRLRRSLADQALAAYGRLNPSAPASTPLRQMLKANIEGNIADALIARLVTAESLTDLLQQGKVKGEAANGFEIPPVGSMSVGQALSRIRFVNPVTMGFKTGEGDIEILMHYESLAWKLAGLKIPDALADKLARQLSDLRTGREAK